jgi:hypothetical protein
MRQFNTLLTLVFLSIFATACKKDNNKPIQPAEPEKWVEADFGLKNSWLKIAENGSKMYILGRSELLTIGESGLVENRYVYPYGNDAYKMGINKEVFYWATYENGKPFLNVAPNDNPDNKRKISLDVFNGQKIYQFLFSGGEPDAGYFNSQNQLLFFNVLSDNSNSYCYVTIDVALTSDKKDFVDCRIVEKKELSFNWRPNALRNSLMIDDRIYFVDYHSTLRFENGGIKIVTPFVGVEYGLDIFKWKGKLYMPFMRFDKKELGYRSSTDNGITWDFEATTDTVSISKMHVLNNKLAATSNTLNNFWVSNGLSGFKKMNTEGLPPINYDYAQFYYFGGFYYVFVEKKAFRIKNL